MYLGVLTYATVHFSQEKTNANVHMTFFYNFDQH